MPPLDTAVTAMEAHRSASGPSRREAVVAALASVMDPELDEAVTEMGFIEAITISRDRVAVDFRLPTFWCSANFAFLMAGDMKLAVGALDWVSVAIVRLVDHFAAGKINRAVAEGRGFGDAFDTGADAGLASLRRTFRDKAFLGRQERLLRHLVARQGLDEALATTVGGLRRLVRSPDAECRALALRYLSMRLEQPGAASDDAAAFIQLGGEPIGAAAYDGHMRAIRRVRGAAEANAEMCRIYLAARYADVAPGTGTALYRGNRYD